MSDRVSLVWFRFDLRLSDQPALLAAAKAGTVVPVYIWSPDEEGNWPLGGATRWWLHHALARLDESLRELGSRLIVRRGPTLATLLDLSRETGASAVYWNRRHEPAATARDAGIKSALRAAGLRVESFNGSLLKEPWELATQSGQPFQVFTPFWRRGCESAGRDIGDGSELAGSRELAEPARHPAPAPEVLAAPLRWPESLPLAALRLLPRLPWDRGFYDRWSPGERGAQAQLARFVAESARSYAAERDRPDRAGTSSLSPHLRFGELSPRQVWEAVAAAHAGAQPARRGTKSGPETFLTEIGWREFAYHILHHFPQTPEAPLRESFGRFPWLDDSRGLAAWQRGETGYPIVDAGMRELWATGWMHNRVRMIVGSFLTKDLLISWRSGAAWFWDTLVDADLASNTLGWQWVSGCGADAAPYFRIFNPVLQGEKFDPAGEYVRSWVPELARLPRDVIHRPWTASAAVLTAAGVRLGATYPTPIVDHSAARQRALQALRKTK